jgi:hypothetical protein
MPSHDDDDDDDDGFIMSLIGKTLWYEVLVATGA